LADPASEFPAVMLAMGVEIEMAAPDAHRPLPADTFFLDRRQTKLDSGELLVALHVPAVRPSQR
jgi:carbon-monoxide dehydrogenase medium subunit